MLPILEKTTDYALIVPYVTRIFPLVERKLEVWSAKPTLFRLSCTKQALASISKRFHCQGGIYASIPSQSAELLHFIVTLQTISDYLDNRDRAVSMKQVFAAASGNHRRRDTESCRDWYNISPS